MRFLVVTGLSGAGKTSVNRYLEDMGAFCVDNLPPNMMFRMMEAIEKSALHRPLVAMAVDVRSGEFFDAKSVSDLIAESRQVGYQIETLYLEASDDVLVSRYKETRRDHPLAGENVSLIQAIGKERAIMQPLRETANYIIDTSVLKPRQLRQKLEMILSGDSQPDAMHIEMNSFGYKRGCPCRRSSCLMCASCRTRSTFRGWAAYRVGCGCARLRLGSPRDAGVHDENAKPADVPDSTLSGGGQAPLVDCHWLYGRRTPQRCHLRGACGVFA